MISYGFYEKDDFSEVVSWVKNKIGYCGLIGIYGELMGVVIVLFYVGEYCEGGVDFYIVDCLFVCFDE